MPGALSSPVVAVDVVAVVVVTPAIMAALYWREMANRERSVQMIPGLQGEPRAGIDLGLAIW